MTFHQLKKQTLELSTDEKWDLVLFLIESLRQESTVKSRKGNLLSLKGIAKTAEK